MPGFEEVWTAAARDREGESVSPALRPRLEAVYTIIVSQPVDLAGLKEGLQELLEFLAGEGRTNANCWAADLFFLLTDYWERDWGGQGLSDDFIEVLARMSEALHDTVQARDVAENFDCLPEQLLERVRRLSISGS